VRCLLHSRPKEVNQSDIIEVMSQHPTEHKGSALDTRQRLKRQRRNGEKDEFPTRKFDPHKKQAGQLHAR
jgi:hypothetical protein